MYVDHMLYHWVIPSVLFKNSKKRKHQIITKLTEKGKKISVLKGHSNNLQTTNASCSQKKQSPRRKREAQTLVKTSRIKKYVKCIFTKYPILEWIYHIKIEENLSKGGENIIHTCEEMDTYKI